ncbi:MAG: hypothetical protein ABJA79_11320, partial [Parafilimonas sp.]
TGFANTTPDITVKVLDAFNKTFNNTENLKWYENDGSYEARFELDGVKSIVWYNKDGELIRMHRYYNEFRLPPFLLSTIRKKMPNEKIFGVTEVTGKNGVEYYITLETEKHWIQLKADATGEFEVYDKFKKA